MTATMTRRETAPSANAATAPLSTLSLFGIAGLAAVVAIHVTDLGGKTDEVAYLGLGYLLLSAAATVAIVLLAQRDDRGWVLGGLTCAATIIGYVLTRTTGLPGSTGDIGNWGETLGIWSLVAEGLVVMVSLYALGLRRKI